MTPKDFLLILIIEAEDWMPGDIPMSSKRHLERHKKWLTGIHYGDCTKVSLTCFRCLSESREKQVNAAMEFMKTSGFTLQTTEGEELPQ